MSCVDLITLAFTKQDCSHHSERGEGFVFEYLNILEAVKAQPLLSVSKPAPVGWWLGTVTSDTAELMECLKSLTPDSNLSDTTCLIFR